MNGPPFVIAHRGASGYLPEHTREAKVLAYGQGADFLEQDVVATSDGRLVVLHDVCLDEVTDVALRFPRRRRSDGRFYVVDFTFDELRTLRIVERRQPGSQQRVFPGRFGDDDVEFRIVAFEDELRLIRALNAATGRVVGVYPEIKSPAFHREHGIDLAAQVLEMLARYGYSGPEDAAVVQCFDPGELQRCRHELGARLRLAQLTEEESGAEVDFDALARYAEIWAPHYSALLDTAGSDVDIRVAEAAREARRAGLELHPYTFRADEVPTYFADVAQQLEFFYEQVGVDAVFCDHPDVAVHARESSAGRPIERPA